MTYEIDRRTVLKGLAAGAVSLTYAGAVSAGGDARYLVLVDHPGVEHRVESAGFSVQHALADGTTLLAVGPSSKRSELEETDGVTEVARDFRLELDTPAFRAEREASAGGRPGGPGTFEGASDSTDEEFFPLQWDKQDLTTDAAIAHERATGADTTVAVIDTGVEFGHTELEDAVDVAAGRLFREGAIRSGTGPVELPVDFLDLSAGTETVTRHVANDVYGHGTHVAGIASASRAGDTGVIGTAPDADVVSLRVFWWTEDADGNAVLFATFGDILTAIDHAAETGMDAMNMSIGTPPLPPEFNATGIRGATERVLSTATSSGTVVVVSAGNSGADLQNGTFTWPNSMAGAMSISATGPNDKLVFYSNFGTNEISVGAPGGGYETLEKTLETDPNEVEWPFPTNLVLNAMDPDTFIGQLLDGVEYAYLAGTSMAAPQVTGTAALVREVAPGSNAEQVEKAIEQGAELVPGESDDELGAGRLNCDRALDADAID